MEGPEKRGLLLSVSLVAAAALAYQLLLMRLLAIVQWEHFAAVIISLALLGHGVSGTLLSLAGRRLLRRFPAWYAASALAFAASAVVCFSLAQRLPFNGLELAWDPRQLLYFAGLYALLSLPFLFAASCFGLAFQRFPERIAPIYAADLMGAGLGVLGILALLYRLSPADGLRVIVALGLLAALPLLWPLSGAGRRACLPLLALAVFAIAIPADWIEPRMTQYKPLPKALNVHGAEVVARRSSPLAQLTVVASPKVPLRHAPGLSLGNTHEPPAQLGLFSDGEGPSVISAYPERPGALDYLEQLLTALPYTLLDAPQVLVLGAGGGAAVLRAHYAGAREIDAVDLNPQVLALVRETFAGFAGGLYRQPEVTLHAADARAFVRAGGGAYDLIVLDAGGSHSANASGIHAAAVDYRFTVEALGDYYQRLAPGGFFMTRLWRKLPPRDSLKLWATAVAALRAAGVAEPATQLALLRNWDSSLLLLKKGPYSAAEIGRLRRFADRRAFEPVFYPGIQPLPGPTAETSRPDYLVLGARALLGPDAVAFLDNYKFNIRPARDDRPFFAHFFKWRVLPELFSLRAQGGLVLLDSGYLILAGALLQALLMSLLLILLPLRVLRPVAAAVSRWRAGGYFLCLGLAFLFIEIASLQRYVLLVGHPLLAAAVVLGGFLVFAGLGSACAAYLSGRRQTLPWVAAGIGAAAALYLLVYPALLNVTAPWPLPVKALAGLLLIAPLAFLMGMPFPLGLSRLAATAPEFIPWAWGINGCASVLSALLAALLAMHAGLTAVILCAVGLYGLAAWVWPDKGALVSR